MSNMRNNALSRSVRHYRRFTRDENLLFSRFFQVLLQSIIGLLQYIAIVEYTDKTAVPKMFV